jgi:hypothetical protein
MFTFLGRHGRNVRPRTVLRRFAKQPKEHCLQQDKCGVLRRVVAGQIRSHDAGTCRVEDDLGAVWGMVLVLTRGP